LSGHPWIYRDALEPFELPSGEVVDIFDKRKRLIAKGFVEAGPIGVRVLTTQAREQVGPALFTARLRTALALRALAAPADSDAYRLVHGEGDRLPGVVCDRYGDYAVVKLDGEGILAFRDALRDVFARELAPLGIRGALLRTSRKQGDDTQLFFGEAPPPEVRVREHGMTLIGNLWEGQKTGLFLDHRESRYRVRQLARGARVLNLYGYTGGFSVGAGLGGAAHVTTVDVAKPAIALAERTFVENGLPAEQHTAHAEDVPEFLRGAAARAERYELVIADPPNFAPSQAHLDAALEAYAALHAACLSLVPTGGLYLAASCSSHVRAPDFLDTLREGARRARVVLSVLEQTGAPFDHPRLLSFPEGDYLKVVLARVAG